MALLGGILQRAAEARRIAYNPARLVRKAPIPERKEARTLAPSTIEALRQAVDRRDATVIANPRLCRPVTAGAARAAVGARP